MHKKLFIPGPTEVSEKTLKEMQKPVIGHRSPEFQELFAGLQPKLQRLMKTRDTVLVFTSSATGAMEAVARNCVGKKSLHLVNGAFSQRWKKIAGENGKKTESIQAEWGKAVEARELEKRLGGKGLEISNGYGAVKEKTFRIGHMGEHTVQEVKELLSAIEKGAGL